MEKLVVVITGASSGIGKATALAFAKKRAQVVLAARRQNLLDELLDEIKDLGGDGVAIQTDVSDTASVHNLVEEAIKHFGIVDVWVNNAGIFVLGDFLDIPPEVFNRVMQVNFFGSVNCTRAILPHFLNQNKGMLINVSSVAGKIGEPYVSPYSASKFAINGFSESLRLELEGTNIHVCTVLPATIDTPLFQHAANYSGKKAQAMPPIYQAEEVAKIIVNLVDHPKSEAYAGTMGAVVYNAHKIAPDFTSKMLAKQVREKHFQDIPESSTDGNALEPMEEGSEISGGWKDKK